ncbi:Oidioi.mRNA.OKI2018_I69.XSR.g14290.t1.cds [Oikopleura dioica]|uniref:Oidioi.mRNA.OKI2018_I69.XSR.g14290.t1.cds n=1 Tax=Oikopleura dioica TaxID=34765 RepID=A0ABN7SB55_OIKDI|nr:Oidioi.mRNA.OKI2018_I69.XSR.g14290.t1.cds [Oikopleura dioica]
MPEAPIVLKQANSRPDEISTDFENESVTDDMRLPKNLSQKRPRPLKDILFVNGDDKNKYLYWNTSQIEENWSTFEFQKQEMRKVDGKLSKICLEVEVVFLSSDFELVIQSFWANVPKEIHENRELSYDLMKIYPESHEMCDEVKRQHIFEEECKNQQPASECKAKNERKIKKSLRCVPNSVLLPNTPRWVKVQKLYGWKPSSSLTISVHAAKGTVVGMDDWLFTECKRPANAENDSKVEVNSEKSKPTATTPSPSPSASVRPKTKKQTTTTTTTTTTTKTTRNKTPPPKKSAPTKPAWRPVKSTSTPNKSPYPTINQFYNAQAGEELAKSSTTSTTKAPPTRPQATKRQATTSTNFAQTPWSGAWNSNEFSPWPTSKASEAPRVYHPPSLQEILHQSPRNIIQPIPSSETPPDSDSQIMEPEESEVIEEKKSSKALAIWMVIIGIIITLICMLYCCYKFDIFNERGK